MNPLYQKTIKLRAEHVDFRRKLRLSTLFTLFQECCIAHTEELGFGREKTLDKGLLWVILSERFLIHRMPEYDEAITLECYQGPMLHYFFPRHLVVKDEKGNELLRGLAVWALIDAKKRDLIDPKAKGIVIEGKEYGGELAPLMRLPLPPKNKKLTWQSTYSLTDINGHLNNAGYVTLAMDEFDPDQRKKEIQEVALTFKKEIPFGESFEVAMGSDETHCGFSGTNFSILFTLR